MATVIDSMILEEAEEEGPPMKATFVDGALVCPACNRPGLERYARRVDLMRQVVDAQGDVVDEHYVQTYGEDEAWFACPACHATFPADHFEWPEEGLEEEYNR